MNYPDSNGIINAEEIGNPPPFYSKICKYFCQMELRAAVDHGVKSGIVSMEQWAEYLNDKFDFILQPSDYLTAESAEELFRTLPILFKTWVRSNNPDLCASLVRQKALDLVEQADNMNTIKLFNQMYNKDSAPDSPDILVDSDDDRVGFTITVGG